MKSKNKTFDIAVIGGGAGGLMAAIKAAMNGKRVALIDANSTPGRKLSATGSGRGNLTNLNANPESYYCKPKEVTKIALQKDNPEIIREFLHQFGIPTFSTDDGWVYPISESAANVAVILTQRAKINGVEMLCNTQITEIIPTHNIYKLKSQNIQFVIEAKNIIIATGGSAAPQLGARENLIPNLQKLGHHLTPFRPALAPIETLPKPAAALLGIRLDAQVQLLKKNCIVAETYGNIIFTQWGVNGPGVMDISSIITPNEVSDYVLQINLLPRADEILATYNVRKENRGMFLANALQAYLPPRAVNFVCESAGITGDSLIPLPQEKIDLICREGSIFRFGVKALKGFKFCQAAAGGVALSDICAETMQSKVMPGMFFVGEVLDVTGPCGGYNLQWAFASGLLAGEKASS